MLMLIHTRLLYKGNLVNPDSFELAEMLSHVIRRTNSPSLTCQ